MTLADLSLDSVVRLLVKAHEQVSSELEKDKDWKALWSVTHDFVLDLHKLGVFGAVEKPIDPTEQQDRAQVEVQAIVDLAKKQARREAELSQMQQGG